MFGRKKPVPPAVPKRVEPAGYDKICVEGEGIEDMSVEELTQQLVNLYGQIPVSPAFEPDFDPT